MYVCIYHVCMCNTFRYYRSINNTNRSTNFTIDMRSHLKASNAYYFFIDSNEKNLIILLYPILTAVIVRLGIWCFELRINCLGISAVYDRSNGFRVTSNLVSLLRKQVDHLVLPLTNCSPVLIVTISSVVVYILINF